jgi:hypothetical protein
VIHQQRREDGNDADAEAYSLNQHINENGYLQTN